MPIHDVGYRNWKGRLTSKWTRWWAISEAGIAAAFKRPWIRRVIFASWLPLLYFGAIFFVFEQTMKMSTSDLLRQNVANQQSIDILTGTEVGQRLDKESTQIMRVGALKQNPMLRQLPNYEAVIAAIESGDEKEMRTTIWNWLLSVFLRYPQGIMTLMIVGLIVPPLISRDVRSRAFLLYYSRPITRMEYLMGKIAIPGSVLVMITLFPAIGLYFFGLMMSPDLSVVADTWLIPIRIVLAAMVCIIPTCLIGLLFSSLTQESRYAGFAWFTVWGLGGVVWWVIYSANTAQMNGAPFESNWSLVSLYSTIGQVQAWIFGLENDMSKVLPSMIVLGLVTTISFLWLYRRVAAPVRI